MSKDGQTELATRQAEPPSSGEIPARSANCESPASRDAPRAVELRIEELVLHGFTPAERYRIGDAVERELARLFAAQGVPATLGQGREITRLDAGAVEIQPGTNAELTGALLAQAIYGGLGQ